MLYGFTVSMIGASLRLGMLQHFDGQRIIHELKPYILDSVKKNIDRPLSSMWQFAPGIDLIQIAHEQMSLKNVYYMKETSFFYEFSENT